MFSESWVQSWGKNDGTLICNLLCLLFTWTWRMERSSREASEPVCNYSPLLKSKLSSLVARLPSPWQQRIDDAVAATSDRCCSSWLRRRRFRSASDVVVANLHGWRRRSLACFASSIRRWLLPVVRKQDGARTYVPVQTRPVLVPVRTCSRLA